MTETVETPLLPARGFGQTKKDVGLDAQHLAELENAAAGDLLATICLDGEVRDLAAQFTVPVFGFLGIANHVVLDRGEASLWAHALGRGDDWVLCGPDKAAHAGTIVAVRDSRIRLPFA